MIFSNAESVLPSFFVDWLLGYITSPKTFLLHMSLFESVQMYVWGGGNFLHAVENSTYERVIMFVHVHTYYG